MMVSCNLYQILYFNDTKYVKLGWIAQNLSLFLSTKKNKIFMILRAFLFISLNQSFGLAVIGTKISFKKLLEDK